MAKGKLGIQVPLALSVLLGFGAADLTSFPTTPAAQAASSQVVGLNNDGVKALNASNFPLAIQKFQEALKLDPSYQLARQNLAIAYNNYGLQLQNNPKEAIKQFHKAAYMDRNNATTLSNLEGIITMMRKNPRLFKDRVDLGDQARAASDFEGAVIEFSEALKLKNDSKLHYKLAEVYRVLDQNDKAIEEYKNAAAAGDSAEIELHLGQAYQAKKDIPNAIASYGKAIALKPDDPDVLDGLVAGWEEALKENPTAPENHIGLGQAFQYRGDFDQAAAEYKQALFFDKNNQTAQRLLGSLAQAKKDKEISKHVDAGVDLQGRKLYDQAIEEYKLALQLDPRNATIWVNIGSAFQQKQDFDSAIDAYKRALALDSANAAAQQGIKASNDQKADKALANAEKAANDAFKLGKYDEAVAKYQELLRADPKNAATHFNLGAAFQALKRIDDAIAEYRSAVLNDPKTAAYQQALDDAITAKVEPIVASAVRSHQEKDYAAAIDKYQQAISLRPKNPAVWSNLAAALYAREDYKKAKEAYSKAVELDPKGQIGNYYLIALIDENFDNAPEAISNYQKYLASAATGQYATPAKERLKALNANPKDTIKIKSEAELAKLKQADEAYQAAVKLQQQKNWDQAAAQYQKAIELNPQEPAYSFAMGTVFQGKFADSKNTSDIDLALKWYQTAVDADPKNKDYKTAFNNALDLKAAPIVDEAIKRQTAGDIPGAIEKYQEALAIIPNDAGTWTNLASALQGSDDFQGARDAFAKAVGLDAKGQVANWYYIGTLDETLGRGQVAVQDYQKYVAAAPTGQFAGPAKQRIQALGANPNAVVKIPTSGEVKVAKTASDAFDKAVKAQEAKNFDEAIGLYQQAIQAVPKEPAYVYALATAYQGKGDMDNAIDAYKKAVAMDPKNQQYKQLLDAAYELKAAPIMDEAIKKHGAGDLAGAIQKYLEALAITPKNAHGWTNLAGAYQASEQFQQARDTYQKAFDLDPKGEQDNTYFIAALDENFNQGAKALQEYQRYVSAAPRGSYVGLAQGRIKALIANPNAVQKIVTMAEQKQAQAAGDAYNNAVKLQQENKLDEAIAEYDKAIAANPSEASYYYSKGTALQGKNDLDGALALYQKAATLNPKEPAYKQLITQLKQAKAAPLLEAAYKKQTEKDAAGNYDLPGAIADYVAALRLADDAGTHFSLGTAYQGNKEPQKALAEYNKALQMDPKLVDNHYWIGTVYEELKQLPLAIQSYKKYLLSAPKGQYAAEAQNRIKILAGGK